MLGELQHAAAADGSAIGVAKMVQLEDIGADERKHAGRIAERVADGRDDETQTRHPPSANPEQ